MEIIFTDATDPTFSLWVSPGECWESVARVRTREEAETIAGAVPKSMKVKVQQVIGQGQFYWAVVCSGRIRSVKNNERNEAGIRRLLTLASSVHLELHRHDKHESVAAAIEEAIR